LARKLDAATREALVERVRFYRELGLTEFYRRPVDESAESSVEVESQAAADESQNPAELADPQAAGSQSQSKPFTEEAAIPPRKPFPAQPPIGDAVSSSDRVAALNIIREEIGECTRCALHKGRNKLVFADGDPNARLLFVGEGPGADEDAQGLPFVGRAGQLLNNMINAMGLKREEVYICNVVKCRPPGNRTPEPEEANTCTPFLFRQIDVVRPQVIVALGAGSCVSRHAADRYVSPGVFAARSATEEGSLGGFADCHEGTGAEVAKQGLKNSRSTGAWYSTLLR